MIRSNNKSVYWLILSMVFLSSLACARGGQIQGGGSNTLPSPTQSRPSGQGPSVTPMVATATFANEEIPQQPSQTEATQLPTPALEPTKDDLSEQIKAQGDGLEEKLNELDWMNQSADTLGDIP